MKIRILRIFSIVAIVGIMISTISIAAETRANPYILTTSASISKSNSGQVEVNFRVTCVRQMDLIGAQKVRIYTSDGVLVKTFWYYDTGCENFLGSGKSIHSSFVSYSGISTESYYAIVSFYAADSTGDTLVSYVTSVA